MDKDNTKRVVPIAIIATVITGLILLFELFIILGLLENQLFLKSKINNTFSNMEENNKLNAKEQIRNSMDSLINDLNYESTTNNVDLNNLEEKENIKLDDVVPVG
jgi:hypothetical protein